MSYSNYCNFLNYLKLPNLYALNRLLTIFMLSPHNGLTCTMYYPLKETCKNVEYALVNALRGQVTNGDSGVPLFDFVSQMNPERTREVARLVLNKFPFNDHEERQNTISDINSFFAFFIIFVILINLPSTTPTIIFGITLLT